MAFSWVRALTAGFDAAAVVSFTVLSSVRTSVEEIAAEGEVPETFRPSD
jgi:hypothetical protein